MVYIVNGESYPILAAKIIAFDLGRTLPNTDLSRDFMGLVVDGSIDLGTHILHPPQIFLQGRMTSQRERAWDRGEIERTL